MADEKNPPSEGTPAGPNSADNPPVTELWLDVSNVKIVGKQLSVQLRADREPQTPRWWKLSPSPDTNILKAVLEALDKKRPVMAKLVGKGNKLTVTEIAIQYAESTTAR